MKRGAHEDTKDIVRRRTLAVCAIETALRFLIAAVIILAPIGLMGCLFRLVGLG